MELEGIRWRRSMSELYGSGFAGLGDWGFATLVAWV